MSELAENLGFNIQRLQIADVRQCLEACCMCIRSCIKFGHRVISEKSPRYPQIIHKWCDWLLKASRLGKSFMRHTVTDSHDWRHLPSLLRRYRHGFSALQLPNFRWDPTMKSLKWIQWEQAFGEGSAYQASDCWFQQKESRDAPGPDRDILISSQSMGSEIPRRCFLRRTVYSRRSAAGSARTKVTMCHKRKCRCRSWLIILCQIHPKTLYLAPFLCLQKNKCWYLRCFCNIKHKTSPKHRYLQCFLMNA